MSTCILLVGHGSRHKPGNREVEVFSSIWQKNNPQWRIEICFIEFAEIALDAGMDKAACGADKVIVLPLILNAAGHVRGEIPYHIQQARQRHPDVNFVYAAHLGATESILTILKRNLRKTLEVMDMPDPRTTGVIILGRGSSDREANGEIAKIARWLFDESEHELIDVAFTGICHPRLELVVQRQVKLGMSQIVLLPYYLFSGTLMERITRQISRLQQQYPQVAMQCAGYFGLEPEIYSVLNERVAAAAKTDYVSTAMLAFDAGDVEFNHHHGCSQDHNSEQEQQRSGSHMCVDC